MAKNIYVIGIGGTGMRCLESFIHLCAIGMYDETNVHLMALDTDKNNGNFKRLTSLVDNYSKINGGRVKSETLFSANLKYYQFSPNYDKSDCTFNTVIDKMSTLSTQVGDDVKVNLSDLIDLSIRPEVGEMSLTHGYRAQTQMGSILMYYAILEEAYASKNNTSSPLRSFLNEIITQGAGQQIFVFGSVFGGTGASTIPVLPAALRDASKILFGDNVNILGGNYFGSVVLTNYFTFEFEHSDAVVAKADKFALNSQAALQFYKNDSTVNDVYKRLYLIGRENMLKVGSGGTGGASQCNPADYIELMSAFAAYDFFKVCDTAKSATNKDEAFGTKSNNRFVYKAIEATTHLKFSNFTEDDSIFMKKLGIMTAVSFLNTAYSLFDNLRLDSVSFDEKELVPLNIYLQLFGIKPYNDDQNREQYGWLNQIYNSAVGDGFTGGAFFMEQLFKCKEVKDFKKYKLNEQLYNMDTPPKFSVGLMTNKFSVVKDKFNTIKPDLESSLESLIERLYLTLKSLYFNE
ncbi:MAG: hypothetical protein R3Y59_03990 [bacterium]